MINETNQVAIVTGASRGIGAAVAERLAGETTVSLVVQPPYRNREQELKVAELLNLTAEDVAEIHQVNTTKLSYRLAWARHYLKRFGLLQNSERGLWAFTLTG